MLDTLRRIVEDINAARDLNEALHLIVTEVKSALHTDVCSVYMTDPVRGEHVLMATDGLRSGAVGTVRLKIGQGLIGLAASRAEPVNVDDAPAHPAFRYIAETAVEAGDHHEGALTENIDRNTWVGMSVQRSVEEVQSRLQDGLAFLATVGSTAPFIGLFGTVWGILNALTAIGIAGQASIDKVAGPVGESLLMTAIGLAVAVPAVLGYNWLVRRNKVTMDAVRGFAADVHGVLMGAKAR
jgi:biopolymer transport protein ExbB/TolQ